jgi:hypothetical protein
VRRAEEELKKPKRQEPGGGGGGHRSEDERQNGGLRLKESGGGHNGHRSEDERQNGGLRLMGSLQLMELLKGLVRCGFKEEESKGKKNERTKKKRSKNLEEKKSENGSKADLAVKDVANPFVPASFVYFPGGDRPSDLSSFVYASSIVFLPVPHQEYDCVVGTNLGDLVLFSSHLLCE